jgi:thiamine kinase-like enzyme
LIERVIEGYPTFCARLASRWPSAVQSTLWQNALRAIDSLDAEPELQQRLREGFDYGSQRDWPLTTVHGDLSCSNLSVQPSGQLVLLDWENFSPSGLIAIDLVRFYYDIALDAKRLRPAAFDALLARARTLLVRQLKTMGFTTQDFSALESIFIAHQVHCTRKKGPAFRPLIGLYLKRDAALTG